MKENNDSLKVMSRGGLAAGLAVLLLAGFSWPGAGVWGPGSHAGATGLLAALVPGSAWAETSGEPQTLCPVLGGKVDKNIYLDHEGKRVYFCCAGCKEAFLKDPAKYTGKASGCGGGAHAHGNQP